ncbi:MAG: DNA polymerase III subunit alpha, partial [Waddliaceae bacterium]|nr:DNA polymerase III subunit alpha [Waddliaceae bacterium]
GITDIEPLRFNLLFERFINPERMSYPDIDVDICMERRGEVIDYMVKKYGQGNIAQIITFGTMKAKMAIKDVGRVLSMPLAKVNALTKLIPDELNITIERSLEIDPDLLREYNEDPEAHQVIDIGRKLEGSIRNTGVHAAGVIVSAEPIIEKIPICRAKDSEMSLTQYAMKPVEAVGMLKVDFLGLKTLTAIQKAVASIRERTGEDIDSAKLPLDDAETFEMLNKGDTLGVFQLESGGMRDLARNLHLDKFEEIIAMVSLYRPGPMDMIPSYVNRKHGREEIEYDHPWLEDILKETYGIMVYQEQVMQIAGSLANFSLGEGDVLRRAMGKKDMKQMSEMRKKFQEGAAENDIDEKTAALIFDKMEKFAEYGFNKSHAAAYAYIAYTTAYLKAHYPTEWMAALMSCDSDDVEKVAKFINEAHKMGIPTLPPDVNDAGKEFAPTDKGIRFAMTAIRGIGEGAVEAIVTERTKNGKYTTLYDFVKRIDTKKVGKKAAENLADAGCFDFTTWTRDAMRQSVEKMYASAAKEREDETHGVISLFTLIEEDQEDLFSSPPDVVAPSTENETFMREKDLLGFFLTGHPMDSYEDTMEKLSCVPLKTSKDIDIGGTFRTAFIIEDSNVKISSKSLRKFAILTISDGEERYELPIWPEMYEEKTHLFDTNKLIYAVVNVQEREGNRQLQCRWCDDLTDVNETMIRSCDNAYDKAKFSEKITRRNDNNKSSKDSGTKRQQPKKPPKAPQQQQQQQINTPSLTINVDANNADLTTILVIKDVLLKHSGDIPVTLDICDDNTTTQIAVGKKYHVNDKKRVHDIVKNVTGVIDTVKV